MERKESGGGAIRCPGDATWMDVAGGLAPPDESARLLAAAAGCTRCADALRYSIGVLSSETSDGEDTMLKGLESSQPAWQLRIAKSIATSVPRRSGVWPWMAAAAAIFFAVCGALLWTQWRERQAPLPLLAQAYTRPRTIELRVPGAVHGGMRSQRGGARVLAGLPPRLLVSPTPLHPPPPPQPLSPV